MTRTAMRFSDKRRTYRGYTLLEMRDGRTQIIGELLGFDTILFTSGSVALAKKRIDSAFARVGRR